MTLVPTKDHGIFILGGVGSHNCLQFKNKNIIVKSQMPEKNFFSAVCKGNKIYIFGGYDNYEKIQLKTCEVYDIDKDEWKTLDVQLNTARSQSSATLFDDDAIFIMGGFNKEMGTLATIEKFDFKNNKITKLDVVMPTALRRFSSCLLYTSPSPRDLSTSRMPSSA